MSPETPSSTPSDPQTASTAQQQAEQQQKATVSRGRPAVFRLIQGVAIIWGALLVAMLSHFYWGTTNWGMFEQLPASVTVLRIEMFKISILACGIAGSLAFAFVWWTWGTENAMNGVLFSIAMRTGVPVFALGGIQFIRTDFPKDELFEIFVVLYLLTLFVETLLCVQLQANCKQVQSED